MNLGPMWLTSEQDPFCVSFRGVQEVTLRVTLNPDWIGGYQGLLHQRSSTPNE